MQTRGSRFAACLGTAAVVVHGIPLVLHGLAHAQLGIYLPSVAANVYIRRALPGAGDGGRAALDGPHSCRRLVAAGIDGRLA